MDVQTTIGVVSALWAFCYVQNADCATNKTIKFESEHRRVRRFTSLGPDTPVLSGMPPPPDTVLRKLEQFKEVECNVKPLADQPMCELWKGVSNLVNPFVIKEVILDPPIRLTFLDRQSFPFELQNFIKKYSKFRGNNESLTVDTGLVEQHCSIDIERALGTVKVDDTLRAVRYELFQKLLFKYRHHFDRVSKKLKSRAKSSLLSLKKPLSKATTFSQVKIMTQNIIDNVQELKSVFRRHNSTLLEHYVGVSAEVKSCTVRLLIQTKCVKDFFMENYRKVYDDLRKKIKDLLQAAKELKVRASEHNSLERNHFGNIRRNFTTLMEDVEKTSVFEDSSTFIGNLSVNFLGHLFFTISHKLSAAKNLNHNNF